MGVIYAVEHAWREDFQSLWLESDSSLVRYFWINE